MRTSLAILSVFAFVSAAQAQSADPAQQVPQSQPAPIVHAYPGMQPGGGYVGARPDGPRQIVDLQPAAGVSVRGDMDHGVQTVAANDGLTELRVVKGRADVTVHHPVNHSEILVDLPGGQISLLKDGFYTFNAETNTVRVLHGEAAAFTPGADPKSKGAKIKEDQQLTLFPNVKLKAVDAAPYEITADLVGGGRMDRGEGGYGGGYGGYGEGFYEGYAPYGYGYPYGYGLYPYGYGYPFGIGVGFGYYGGFGGYRGGFGGYRGGFRR